MPFKFNWLILLASIFCLQFTEISDYVNVFQIIKHRTPDFSHTFTVNLAVFAPKPRWHQKPWKGLLYNFKAK